MSAAAARISVLLKLSKTRAFTVDERIEWENLLGIAGDSSDDDRGPIGGPDGPQSDSDNDYPDDSDDSDFEGIHANAPPLLDFAEIDRAEEIIADAARDDADDDSGADGDGDDAEPTAAIEAANRGQRYVGQGKQDNTK